MRLSEAARLGSLLKRQAFDSFEPGKSCFLRAVAEAVGIRDVEVEGGKRRLNYLELHRRFPILLVWVKHPVYGHLCTLEGMIFSLNDSLMWSRECIADVVEQVEEAHEQRMHAKKAEVAVCATSAAPGSIQIRKTGIETASA